MILKPDPQTYDIKKLNASIIPDNATVVCIGRRRTGKTVLVTDLLWHKRHISTGIVMSGTEEGNHYYRNYVPDSFVHSEFNEDAIWMVINRQKKIMKRTGKDPPPCFVVLDDCLYDQRAFNTKGVRCLFMNGRHFAIFCIVTLQWSRNFPPSLRGNCDVVFAAQESAHETKFKLYKDFFGCFDSVASFKVVMDACTEDYGVIVLDNASSRSNAVSDSVRWYKAKLRKPFRVGSKQFWQFHEKHYNPNWDDEDAPPTTKSLVNKLK